MNGTGVHRAGLVAAALVTGLLASAAPARADALAGVASVGSADFTRNGEAVTVETLAPCDVDGATTNTSVPVAVGGLAFGAGASSCTRTVVDEVNSVTTTHSEATGEKFELSALVPAGGPRLKVGTWKIVCDATQTGTNAGWQVSGVTGFAGLPEQVPTNHLHEVTRPDGTVLARVIFSEVVLPEPNDGSIAMNLMRFEFTPASGLTGGLVVGSTECAPTP
ncbi:hypothetical protein [Umezawaea beigongshangensis]|uniref:hypothetical protein n=1 Tax=Umezawaea beigongshangensis TaxID=2780383 RepID=UPI0018F18A64|nr:hypothetical protein [Umezawaea beigongshangensis]